MPVNLEIEDGNPWYLSPNVWAVPGDNPEGPPGTPIVGQPAYLWARVRNTGQTGVTDAAVRFYWANPAVGFDRTTANFVGTASVNLPAGGVADVLCLTPWDPIYVNEGHECILAEAFHASDPLPGGAAFNVPTDRHVAQRNISVVQAADGMFRFTFEIHNPGRKAGAFTVRAEQGKLGQLERLKGLLGRDFKLPDAEGRVGRLGFVRPPCPDPREVEGAVKVIEGLKLGPRGRAGFTLIGEVEGGAALVHVTQEADGREVGGLAVLVLPAADDRQHKGERS